MAYYTIVNGIIAGICFGFGIISLFIALRRREKKRLNLLFAVFALSYAATLFNGIRFHNTTSVEAHLSIVRGDTIFVTLAFIAFIWYVAEYTEFKPRLFLWGLTAIFVATGITQFVRANLIYDQIIGVDTVLMPWGEQVAYLDATDSAWSLLFLAAQLAVLGFSALACIRQYQRGERSEALILSIGVLWFVVAIGAEILGEVGIITPIFYGEFGFLGFVVSISLQISNDIIKSNEQLLAYRGNLEELVRQRTNELDATQMKLLQQTREQATIEERSRLARDLHDAVTQTIYSAALISEALPTVWDRNQEEGRRNLAKLRQLIRGALAELRTLLFELRPDSLAAADFDTLLRQLSDAFTGRTRIPVTLRGDGTIELPAGVKVTLYRIAQEAFNNIEKHAQADRVMVTLDQRVDRVSLIIWDNGRGFEPNEEVAGKMGQKIMVERAQSIGADLEVTSQAGKGSTVRVRWPNDDKIAGADGTKVAGPKDRSEESYE